MKITVTLDVKAVKTMQKDIPQSIIPAVLARGLNKMLQATHVTAVKTIANASGVKQKIVRDFLVLTKAQRQCLTAVLRAPHKRRLTLLMMDAQARQNARGVAYRLGGQRKQVDHAFIVTMKNGHRGIYARKAGAKRLPIRELQGPSIAYLFVQPAVQQALQNTIDSRWQPLVEHELHYALQRRDYTP